jgi:hypothetical protein
VTLLRRAIRPSPVALAGALLAVAAMGGVGLLPLIEGPGYESALAAGLLLPSVAALATALDVLAARRQAPGAGPGPGPQPLDSFARGLAMGGALAIVGWALTLAHGLATGFCDLTGGSATFALGPGIGALMGGAWGALAGEAAAGAGGRRRARAAAVLFALAGPLGGIAVSLGRFYTSPMVFAFDPFFGFFAGPLDDPVLDAPARLLTYRAGSAMTLAAAGALAALLCREATGRLAWRRPTRVALVILAVAAASGSLAHALAGARLGHWQTTTTIARALGGRSRGSRCDVIHARALAGPGLSPFVRECDGAVRTVEAYLETRGPETITVFLFRDATEKRRLTGAWLRLVSKPWRAEVYLHSHEYPHDWLGHELAHVIAAGFGRGPLRVAGSASGLIPDFGLIEGLAVGAWPPADDLTPSEWSRTMLEARLLPPLRRVFALRFLDLPTVTSYTVAGAFVGWVRDRWGAAAVRRWYAGEPLPAVTGHRVEELEAGWHADLRRLALPPAAVAAAGARFDRPSVFRRRCRHLVDRRLRDGEEAAARGDCPLARRHFDEARRYAPGGVPAFALAWCLARAGAPGEAAALLAAVAADASGRRPVRDRALMELGDLHARAGRWREARAAWDEVAGRAFGDDALRLLEIKRQALADEAACARRDPGCIAVVELLAGGGGRDPQAFSAAARLGAWAEREPASGLPDYLLGRILMNHHLWTEGARRLDRALARPLPGARVRRDAWRQRAIAACALDEPPAATAAYHVWLALSPPTGQREPVRRLVAGCGGEG